MFRKLKHQIQADEGEDRRESMKKESKSARGRALDSHGEDAREPEYQTARRACSHFLDLIGFRADSLLRLPDVATS